jgi:hypothetical protein
MVPLLAEHRMYPEGCVMSLVCFLSFSWMPGPPSLNWHYAMPAVFSLLLLLGAAIFLVGALLARHAKDYRDDELQSEVAEATAAEVA